MRFVSMISGLLLFALLAVPGLAADSPDVPLFRWENPTDIGAWAPVKLADAKGEQPVPKIGLSAKDPVTGKASLQITFVGGQWPTIGTTVIPVKGTWKEFQTIKADLILEHEGIAYLAIGQGEQDAKALKPQWWKTLIRKAGRNEVVLLIRHGLGRTVIDPKEGNISQFTIGMFQPADGQVLRVENVRLSADWPEPKMTGWFTPFNHDGYSVWFANDYQKTHALPSFQVLGTDMRVSGYEELSKKLKDSWKPAEEKTIDQVEADFKAKLEDIKKTHPSAVLAILRDGEKGFDPASPEALYAGWKNAYMSCHGPDGPNAGREAVGGIKGDTVEAFMRHRSVILQADFSSIPKGATILAARLVLTRTMAKDLKNPIKPNVWVTEPCTREWEEEAANCYWYARGKRWKAVSGLYYGEDADFLPVLMSHGPGSAPVNEWDFTHAMKFWLEEGHANHGFFFYGDSNDHMRIYTRLAKEVRKRPAIMVIYSPK